MEAVVPIALPLVAAERSSAADLALAEVLPTLAPAEQESTVAWLATRGDPQAVSVLVERFTSLCPPLRSIVAGTASRLSTAIRNAARSPQPEIRASAVQFIAESGESSLVYLLVEELLHADAAGRAVAAQGIARLAAETLSRRDATQTPEALRETRRSLRNVEESLEKVVTTWDAHRQQPALRAALWFDDAAPRWMEHRLARSSTALEKAVAALLIEADDPRLAPMTWRALASPHLRRHAARAVEAASRPEFIRAFLACGWLLGDPAIAAGCRAIRQLPWLSGLLAAPGALQEYQAMTLATLLRIVNGNGPLLASAYDELLYSSHSALRRSAFWNLVADTGPASTTRLMRLAARVGDEWSVIAARELARRSRNGPRAPVAVSNPGSVQDVLAHRAFEEYWSSFDELAAEEIERLTEALKPLATRLSEPLSARLSSPRAVDRLRALNLVRVLGLVRALAESLHVLARDADPVIRSQAVALLAEAPGPTTIRILRDALHDPEPRVAANALESLDRLEVPELEAHLRPLLTSSNARLRASAVLSLLQLDFPGAVSVLHEMIESTCRSQRLAALWVMERAKVTEVLDHVAVLQDSDPDARVRRRARRLCDRFGTCSVVGGLL